VTAIKAVFQQLCYLQIDQWHTADDYDGQVREITLYFVTANVYPKHTTVRDWQHRVVLPNLVRLLLLFTYDEIAKENVMIIIVF